MKKFILLALVAMVMASCFRSVETPIAGTDLVTYTAKDQVAVGIKHPGQNGAVISDAIYAPGKVVLVNNRLSAQVYSATPATVNYRLLGLDGKTIIGEDLLSVTGHNGFIFARSTKGAYYVKDGAQPFGPKETMYQWEGKLFYKENGLWCLKDAPAIVGADKIIVLSEDGKPENNRYFVHTPAVPAVKSVDPAKAVKAVAAAWKVYDVKGKLLKSTTQARVDAMIRAGNDIKYKPKVWANADKDISGYTVTRAASY